MTLLDTRNANKATIDSEDDSGTLIPIKLVPALVVVVLLLGVVLAVRGIRVVRSVSPSPPWIFVDSDDSSKGERLSLPTDSLFDVDKADIKEAGLGPIKEFAKKAKALDTVRIVVIGHTDPTGTVKHNDRLSLARAEAVRKILLAEDLAASQVSTAGVGSRILLKKRDECPGADHDLKVVACLAPDRRVELWAKTIDAPMR